MSHDPNNAFNPLTVARGHVDEIQMLEDARHSLENVIDSYHRNFDVFAEIIQNAVDAVHARYLEEGEGYTPKIWVEINQLRNEISVCDNGIGISESAFERVLAPNVSYKKKRSAADRSFRGHKGVGLSFLAYGFNYIRVSTRVGEWSRSGELSGGRAWITGAQSESPEVVPALEPFSMFENLSRGTVVTVRVDQTTRPKSLSHIATTALEWAKILRSQTALGMVTLNQTSLFPLAAEVSTVRRDDGGSAVVEPVFLYPHLLSPVESESGSNKYLDLKTYYLENPNRPSVPNVHKRNHGIYRTWSTHELGDSDLRLTPEEVNWLQDRNAWAYGFMAYSADFWKENQADPNKANSATVAQSGLVFASEAMTIGDYREISLNRYIGRQKQVAVVLHIDGLRTDMGRKSFETDVVETGQLLARRIVEWFARDNRHVDFLRAERDKKGKDSLSLEDWKFEANDWAKSNPLAWGDRSFPLASEPRQEQDVVILFSQLLAHEVLEGYTVLGTAEGNRQYDSLVRLSYDHTAATPFGIGYPQGLHVESLKERATTTTPIQVTEFKFDLASIVRDFGDARKVFNDVDLAIAWTARGGFSDGVLGDYELFTVSTPDTVADREWHGQTHQLRKSGSDHTIRVIVLEDLFQLRNDWQEGLLHQIRNYRL